MVAFSSHVIRSWGYRPFNPTESISGHFYSLTVYEIRGITLPESAVETIDGTVSKVGYRVALSSSANLACQALIKGNLRGDEEEWKKEKNVKGPIAVVMIGPTNQHTCSNGWVKDDDSEGCVDTYDSFPLVRPELQQLEERSLLPVLTALTCVLNDDGRTVMLRKVDRAQIGLMADGKVIRDDRVEMHAEMYSSYAMVDEQLRERLAAAKGLARKLNPKSARFFALGLGESDQLKKFLYFFLALEVETHAAFGKINHASSLTNVLGNSVSGGKAVSALLQTQVKNLRGLRDRFVWCAASCWPQLTEDDVAQFIELKDARDNIAHGSASEPPKGYARRAEILARKILWSP